MQWTPLTRIQTDGLNYMGAKLAGILNKQMEELEAFRAKVDAKDTKLFHGRPGEPVDEAMRRELILRHDVVKLCEKYRREPGDHVPLLAAARAFLDERETHITRNRGGF